MGGASFDESIPFRPVRIAVMTVSDTRTEADDKSGAYLVEAAQESGHQVMDKVIIPDDRKRIEVQLRRWINEPNVEVILATGIEPRTPAIEGIDHPKVLSYLDVLQKKAPVGERVAIIGAGGIGFDVAEYLTHGDESPSTDIEQFMSQWGVDMNLDARGGIEGVQAIVPPSPRKVTLLQRKASKVGAGLGKTTGWIHRLGLEKKGVQMMPGCDYRRIDDAGLHIAIDGQERLLEVDNIVVCAGQEPRRELMEGLNGMTVHLIGGADVAAELDAKRAIDQGTRLAARL